MKKRKFNCLSNCLLNYKNGREKISDATSRGTPLERLRNSAQNSTCHPRKFVWFYPRLPSWREHVLGKGNHVCVLGTTNKVCCFSFREKNDTVSLFSFVLTAPIKTALVKQIYNKFIPSRIP